MAKVLLAVEMRNGRIFYTDTDASSLEEYLNVLKEDKESQKFFETVFKDDTRSFFIGKFVFRSADIIAIYPVEGLYAK